MAVEYKQATKKFMETFNKLIVDHRPDLVDCTFKVTEASKLGGRRFMNVGKPSASEIEAGNDLAVVYSGEVFANLTEEQARAEIDNALAYWKGEEKTTRKGQTKRTVYKKNNPLELHPDVVKRHGLIRQEWREAVEALGQMDLFDDTRSPNPPPTRNARKAKGTKGKATQPAMASA